MTVCKHVRYSGQVQGVGFRYTAERLAEGYPVSGYVRNLPGGDVELVAEGPAADVEAFLAALAQRMAGYIERTSVLDEPVGGHSRFRIRT
jgi:acylphosphatase